MRKFVEINFQWHQLSHVIYCDNKPMCLATAYLKSPGKQPMDTFWIKGWKAFKKHEHLFPHLISFFIVISMKVKRDGNQYIYLSLTKSDGKMFK